MRVPAIEAALKANWAAGALDSVTISASGLLTRYPWLVRLSRQSDQGDGAARGHRGLIALTAFQAARQRARRFVFGRGLANGACYIHPKARQFRLGRFNEKTTCSTDRTPQSLHPRLRPARGFPYRRIRRHRSRTLCLHDAGGYGRGGSHARSRRGAKKNLKSSAGRGRKVVELDLKDKTAIAQVLDLLSNADALIEGFRPGRDGAAGARPGCRCWRETRAWSMAA